MRKVLGKGGFGIVYLVESEDKSNLYAVKMLLEEGRRDSEDEATFAKEARIGLELGAHTFVVHTHHVRSIARTARSIQRASPAILRNLLLPSGPGQRPFSGKIV